MVGCGSSAAGGGGACTTAGKTHLRRVEWDLRCESERTASEALEVQEQWRVDRIEKEHA